MSSDPTRELPTDQTGAPTTSQQERGTVAVLRDALAYAQSIIDTVREPMLVLDSTLHVQTASRAFLNLFGVSREDTIGSFIYDLGNGQWNIPALRTLLEKVLTQYEDFQDFEVTHEFPMLGKRTMLLNARKLWTKENNSHLVLLAFEDITGRKRLHDELVESNQEMQRFAYVAAHDLRTPLHAAQNLVLLLERRVQTKLNVEEREILRHLNESLERLSTLMGDILSFADTSNAPQQRARIRLEEALDVALANLQHHIDHQGATITRGALPEVFADRTQMVMVFQNLIGNALKYRRDEPPQVRIEAVREEGAWRIAVADNGQGFGAEHATIIFEPFRRLHSKSIKGTGIGLATCKRIVERSGGRIWAHAIPGQGATFYFTLPD
jgi:two-component system, chemotaxis family, CheB/CheR fusion protein